MAVLITALITNQRTESDSRRHYIDVTLTDVTNSESTNVSLEIVATDPTETEAYINSVLDAAMDEYGKREMWTTVVDSMITAAVARELTVET